VIEITPTGRKQGVRPVALTGVVPGRLTDAGRRNGSCAAAALQHLPASTPWPIAPIYATVYN
jgi:hypothetical protein